jgi:hypothetical protein
MYMGPLKWPPLWVWLSTIGLMAFIGLLGVLLSPLGLEVVASAAVVIAFIAILVIAAPRRVQDLGGPGLGDPPDKESAE